MSQQSLLESLGGIAPPASAVLSTKEGNTSHVGLTTSTEERALTLLGTGIQPEQVAAALGVTASRISQLLSNEVFALKVATLRYENLQKHNLRDAEYDSLEDSLIDKLKKSLPLMVRPDTILKAINIVNAAKRRGQSSPDQAVASQNIVNILLPTQIVQQFVTNLDNQVTRAGNQDLLTMPSGQLLENMENTQKERAELQIESDSNNDEKERASKP